MTISPRFIALLLTAALATGSSCSSSPGPIEEGAKPEFCGWGTQIEAAIPPTPEPVSANPDEPPDIDRLVLISEQLSAFAGTLESAAAFAPSSTQSSFTQLAAFNREVANVITGSGSLRDSASDSAKGAADVVVQTLASECGISIDATDTLAFSDG